MASSDNLASIEPWLFRPTFADSWIPDAFVRDTETVTKALQKSFSDDHSGNVTVGDYAFSQFFNLTGPDTPSSVQTPSGSGSDLETTTATALAVVPNRRGAGNRTPASGKITKRKSRASKRTTTTFITADPANFRQMVQQVTGVRFVEGPMSVAPLVKPEPQRPVASRFSSCLPTLDTSAFLLNHHQQQQVMTPTSACQLPIKAPSPPSTAVADGCSGFDFDSFANFPTLESWKVM